MDEVTTNESTTAEVLSGEQQDGSPIVAAGQAGTPVEPVVPQTDATAPNTAATPAPTPAGIVAPAQDDSAKVPVILEHLFAGHDEIIEIKGMEFKVVSVDAMTIRLKRQDILQ